MSKIKLVDGAIDEGEFQHSGRLSSGPSLCESTWCYLSGAILRAASACCVRRQLAEGDGTMAISADSYLSTSPDHKKWTAPFR